ncbi:MAG: hypothetical protein QMC67_07230 [Candidatus Wallbacteria bacterium]
MLRQYLRTIIKSKYLLLIITFFAVIFLFYLIFLNELANLSSSIGKKMGPAGGVKWAYNGTINFNDAVLKLGSNDRLNIKTAVFKFNPLYNLTELASGELDITFAEADPDFFLNEKKYQSLLKNIYQEIAAYSKNAKIKVKMQCQCNKPASVFYGYKLKTKPKVSSVILAAEIFDDKIKFQDAGIKYYSNYTSSEINIQRGSDNLYNLTMDTVPLELLNFEFLNQKNMNFKDGFFSAKFKVKTLSFDNAGAGDFSEISGRAVKIGINYVPFNSVLNASFNFSINAGKIDLSELASDGLDNNKASRVTGFINLKNRVVAIEMLVPDFDISCFASCFRSSQDIISHYSPDGTGKVFLRLEGTIDKPEFYGELSLNNSILQGDAGFKNINNLSGNINFSNSQIKIIDLKGRLLNSNVEISGDMYLTDTNEIIPNISINFVEMPIKELKETMAIKNNDLEKFLNSITDGTINLAAKISKNIKETQVTATGNFSKCKIDLPLKNEILKLTEIGGNISISKNNIEFSNSYGFMGNVPFFFSGSISRSSFQLFNFNIKFNNLDFSDFTPIQANFDNFGIVLSRLQVREKSLFDVQISSENSSEISIKTNFKLTQPEVSLFPLPFSLTIENINGFVNVSYDYKTGVIRNDGIEIKTKGNCKISILSFLYQSIPISISGSAYGEIGIAEKSNKEKYITGYINMDSPILRYFDNKYVEVITKLSGFEAKYNIDQSVLSGNCKFGILSGNVKCDYKCNFSNSNLYNNLTFVMDQVNLEQLYAENPKLLKCVEGKMALQFKTNFENNNKSINSTSGKIYFASGQMKNLNRFDFITKKEIIPNTIYEFQKFSFDFNLSKTKIKLSNLSYDGSQKSEFQKLFNSFSDEIILDK